MSRRHACDSIVLDYTKWAPVYEDPKTVNIPVAAFEVHDSYPDAPVLCSTAEAGCELCALFRSTAMARIRSLTPHEENLACGGTGPVRFSIGKAELLMKNLPSARGGVEATVYALEAVLVVAKLQLEETLHFFVRVERGDKEAGRICDSHRLVDDPCSPASRDIMEGWIHECESTHDICRTARTKVLQQPNKRLPTRVLDVGTEIESRTYCTLVETDAQTSGDYVALSYVWGPVIVLTTTTSTLQERKQRIDLVSLPQTMCDAVKITRLLGVQYLWIDALCILQDSKEDWQREAAQMGHVYKDAYITIAATCAATSTNGFLGPRTTPEAKFQLRVVTPAGPQTTCWVYVSTLDKEGPKNQRLLEVDLDDSIWNTRAWTMQERYISQRVIHFGKHMMYFECRASYQTEDNEGELDPPLPTFVRPLVERLRLPELSDDDSDMEMSEGSYSGTDSEISAQMVESPWTLYDVWYGYVARYTRRNITFASDKLPALSALAQEAAAALDDQYLAGLWRKDLVNGLLWLAPDDGNVKAAPSYRAPSWSWANMACPVEWPAHISTMPPVIRPRMTWPPDKAEIELLTAEIDVHGVDSHGAVDGARLLLRGKVTPVTLTGPFARVGEYCAWDSDVGDYIIREVKYEQPPPAQALRTNGSWNNSRSLSSQPAESQQVEVIPFNARFTYDMFDGEGRNIGRGHLDFRELPAPGDECKFVCLQIYKHPEFAPRIELWPGLLLQEVADKTYRRVGLFILNEEYDDYFDEMEESLVTLI